MKSYAQFHEDMKAGKKNLEKMLQAMLSGQLQKMAGFAMEVEDELKGESSDVKKMAKAINKLAGQLGEGKIKPNKVDKEIEKLGDMADKLQRKLK